MIFEKVQEIMAEQFSVETEEITMETDLVEDLAADSLDMVELVMNLEEVFNLPETDEKEAATLTTVKAIVDYIAGHTK